MGVEAGFTSNGTEDIRLSALFCDIKGYTVLSERMPPAKLGALLNEFYAEMSGVVQLHHGRIDKLLGDGLIAYFLEVEGEENYARNAVDCALAMQELAEELRPGWRDPRVNTDLRIRIGVATSEVSISVFQLPDHTESTMLGTGVVLAARLQEKSPVGGVLVCTRTYEATRDLFPYQRLVGVELKGYKDCVDAYALHHRQAAASQADGDHPESTDEGDSHTNKRRYPRQPCEYVVRYTVNGNTSRVQTLNVSRGGALLTADRHQEVGAQVRIETGIPTAAGAFPIHLDGEVVRCDYAPNGQSLIGVRFDEVRSGGEQTTAFFVDEIFGLSRLAADEEEHQSELPASDSLPEAGQWEVRFCEAEGLRPDIGGYFLRRLEHEVQRTKRYGREFACIAVQLVDADGADERLRDLTALGAALNSALRNTDEVVYVGSGRFIVLAPETLPERAVTLTKRLVESALHLLERLGESLEIRTGVVIFDGHNARSGVEVMQLALQKCRGETGADPT